MFWVDFLKLLLNLYPFFITVVVRWFLVWSLISYVTSIPIKNTVQSLHRLLQTPIRSSLHVHPFETFSLLKNYRHIELFFSKFHYFVHPLTARIASYIIFFNKWNSCIKCSTLLLPLKGQLKQTLSI